MSLQIWLPLNGNLKNQGLNNVTVTNNGATVNTNGKIGSCYSFDGANNQYLELDTPLGPYYNNDFSWAVWLKPNSAKRGIILSEYAGTGSGNVALELTAALKVRVYWNGSPDIYTNDTIPINTWSHIAVTKTANQILFYINGTLIYTHNQPNGFSTRTSTCKARIGDDYRSGTVVDYDGSINDFRIYDHALSPKEVKEISKGLVCHYALDGFTNGANPNLFRKTYFSPGEITSDDFGANDTTWTRSVRFYNGSAALHHFENGIDTISLSSSGNIGVCFQRKASDIELDTTAHYTISCEAKCTKANAHLDIGLSYYNTSNGWVWRGGSNPQNFIAVDTWQKFKLTFTPDSNTQYIDYCFTVIGSSGGTDTFSIRRCKLEKGDVATDWLPNELDITYGKLGYDSSEMPDISGITKTKATIPRTTYISPDSTRYNASMLFTREDKSAVNLPNISFENMDYGTVSFWFQPQSFKDWSHFVFFANGFNWTGREYDFIIVASNSNYGDTTDTSKAVCVDCCSYTSSYTLDCGTWYHIVITWDAVNYVIKKYLNGVLKTTNNDATNHRLDVYKAKHNIHGLGNINNNDTYRGQFLMSDFRIYATVLSEADIKELYNIPVTIADNGSMLTQGEFSENGTGVKINSTGVVEAENCFIESTSATINEDLYITANQIIEI